MLEGDRCGWVVERVSKDTQGPGGKSRNTANGAETHPWQPEPGCSGRPRGQAGHCGSAPQLRVRL